MDYGLSKDMCYHGFRGLWLMGFLETCASAGLDWLQVQGVLSCTSRAWARSTLKIEGRGRQQQKP